MTAVTAPAALPAEGVPMRASASATPAMTVPAAPPRLCALRPGEAGGQQGASQEAEHAATGDRLTRVVSEGRVCSFVHCWAPLMVIPSCGATLAPLCCVWSRPVAAGAA
jgi:hypothetical protein